MNVKFTINTVPEFTRTLSLLWYTIQHSNFIQKCTTDYVGLGLRITQVQSGDKASTSNIYSATEKLQYPTIVQDTS